MSVAVDEANVRSQHILHRNLGSVRSCSRWPRPDPGGKEETQVVHALQMVDAKRRGISSVRRSMYSEEGEGKRLGALQEGGSGPCT